MARVYNVNIIDVPYNRISLDIKTPVPFSVLKVELYSLITCVNIFDSQLHKKEVIRWPVPTYIYNVYYTIFVQRNLASARRFISNM